MSGAWKYVAVAVAVALVGYFLYRAAQAAIDLAKRGAEAAGNAIVHVTAEAANAIAVDNTVSAEDDPVQFLQRNGAIP